MFRGMTGITEKNKSLETVARPLGKLQIATKLFQTINTVTKTKRSYHSQLLRRSKK